MRPFINYTTSFLFLFLILIFPAPSLMANDGRSDLPPHKTNLLTPDKVDKIVEYAKKNKIDTGPKEIGSKTRGAALKNLYRKTRRSVPLIMTSSPDGEITFGSGVILNRNSQNSSALVITNQHVVSTPMTESGVEYAVLFFYTPNFSEMLGDSVALEACLNTLKEEMLSNKPQKCRTPSDAVRLGIIISSDSEKDLAVLLVSNLPPDIKGIPLGTLDNLDAGDDIVVIGHPKGLYWSLSTGIISAIRAPAKTVPEDRANSTTLIQTSAPINPGNSGGPMLTEDGRVVGIIVSMLTTPVENSNKPDEVIQLPTQGLNFAISINDVKKFLTQTEEETRRAHP